VLKKGERGGKDRGQRRKDKEREEGGGIERTDREKE
jgi:hypothetical protein